MFALFSTLVDIMLFCFDNFGKLDLDFRRLRGGKWESTKVGASWTWGPKSKYVIYLHWQKDTAERRVRAGKRVKIFHGMTDNEE